MHTKQKISILEIILRFFFGFLIPYVLINGIIFFLYIQVPSINIVQPDSKEYEADKVKFSVECFLPITNVKTYFNDTEIAYKKLGDYYIIDASDNGLYKIDVVALNNATDSATGAVETKDAVAPSIDFDNAIITGNVLIFSVYDDQAQINYDNIYATLENGERIYPTYMDKSSGNIQFKIESGEKLVVHVEDIDGNSSEASFSIGE